MSCMLDNSGDVDINDVTFTDTQGRRRLVWFLFQTPEQLSTFLYSFGVDSILVQFFINWWNLQYGFDTPPASSTPSGSTPSASNTCSPDEGARRNCD